MTRYLIRVTDIAERRVYDIEKVNLDLIEDAQLRAIEFAAQCFPHDTSDMKTTILLKSEPDVERWAVNCWRFDGEWIYPGDVEDIL